MSDDKEEIQELDLREVRCTNCKRLLCKEKVRGIIEVKCHRCKTVTTVKSK